MRDGGVDPGDGGETQRTVEMKMKLYFLEFRLTQT